MTEKTSSSRSTRRRRRRPAGASGTATPSIETETATEVAATAVTTPTGFARLGVPDEIDAGLAAAGFSEPFAIQLEAIPVALKGVDVCGRARTGSGKTLAFGVPMIARVGQGATSRRPRALVLVPTRELALQVADVLTPVAKARGLHTLAVYGGASRPHQVGALLQGVEIVVATPLRLVDLIKAGDVVLDDVEIVVVDEADRMADDGFTPQVEWLLRHVTKPHQTMLFSATLDGQVGHLVRRYLNDPVEVSVDEATDTVGTMHHLFLGVHRMDKDRVVAAIARNNERVVVFCHTKRSCDKVADALHELGVSVRAIHGDLPQVTREKALRRFAAGEIKVLVATDVAARGIDIDGIDVVVHHEPAADSKAYLHRSGRTARAGRDGWAVTLAEYNQHLACRIIQRQLRLELVDPIEVFSNDKRFCDLHLFREAEALEASG